LAKFLAKALINAKSVEEVASAFSDIIVDRVRLQNTNADGTVDEAALQAARVEATVKKASFEGEMLIAELAESITDACANATSEEEVDQIW